MQIFVDLMTGRTISVEVESWYTIDNVKAKIEEREGIPSYKQMLIFDGMLLDGSRTLADHNLHWVSAGFKCFWSRQQVAESSVDRSGRQIFVDLMTGRRISVEVESWYTIDNVKAKIEEREGIPSYKQMLIFDGMLLDGSRTLADHNLHWVSAGFKCFWPRQQVAESSVDRSGRRIFVDLMTGRRISVEVESWYTVDNVKAKIEEREGIPSYKQMLIFKGMLLDGSRTLADYNLYMQSVGFKCHW